MTRTLSFIITGPPTLDVGTFVAIVDDETGASVDVGWWQHDGAHWRYSMPYEFAPRLVTPPPASSVSSTVGSMRSATSSDPELQALIGQSDAISARQRLRERVRNAPRKDAAQEAAATTAAASAPVPAHFELCGNCRQRFDPGVHELLACGNCGEDRCTANCLPDPVRPCLDCQALEGAAEENELVGAPPSGPLFDGVFRPDPRKVEQARAAGDDIDEGDD